MAKINVIDLFAGCGGLSEGFEQTKSYHMIAAVEWDKAPIECLRNRMKTKWGMKDSEERIMRFDMQRTDELLHGWSDDADYGTSKGLDYFVNKDGGEVDLIIGGPPCQAYSIAGRVRDENGMKDDYRNYLFESYLEIVKEYHPKAFVFENVPGILSARPGDGELVVDKIRKAFDEAGYMLLDDLKDAIIDMSEYGIPQKRNRIIILGVNKDLGADDCKKILDNFYNNILPKYKVKKKKTVFDAIGDLPKLYPLENGQIYRENGKKFSHTFADLEVKNHKPRFHSERDINLFRMLCEDIESGSNKYVSTDSLKELYTQVTGKKSNVHKFYVLRWDEPSNLIPAHLFKDGLRHIHPDSKQARSITVREAARLQTFPDDFEFISNSNLDYKMIGNAVPPMFANIIAKAVKEVLFS
ncbi:MAG: DNA cytosine methyltransferase [Lachnospiraceae bacterium]|nr:DNA cytosine methyltransferase [Lachnospiraceae bacterium]